MKYTRGSLLIATLLHGSTNTFGFLTPGLDPATRWWLIALVYGLAALLVAIIFGVSLDRTRSAGPSEFPLSANAPPEPEVFHRRS